MFEKSRVEKSGVEKFMVEKSGVEMSFNLLITYTIKSSFSYLKYLLWINPAGLNSACRSGQEWKLISREITFVGKLS